jgi:hypothetical protein
MAMNRFNLPDDVTLDMIDDHFGSPDPVGTCARCGDELDEESAHCFDGDDYCSGCLDQVAREADRYCSNCGVVEHECFTTAFNDEPYCRPCLLQQLTNLRRLGEIFELGVANGVPLVTPVVFVLEGDADTTYIGTHEVIQHEKIVLHIAPVSAGDTEILQAALDEAISAARVTFVSGLQPTRSEIQ